MKRRWVGLFLVLFVGVAQINAQVFKGTSGNDTSNAIRFGPKAGLGATTFSGGDFSVVDVKVGGYVGAFAEMPAFVDDLYFQPELMVALKGATVDVGNLNLVYLQIPLMVKYHITDDIAAELGPQFGLLINDNGDKDPFSGVDPNTFDFGINIGGGYLLKDTYYFQLRFEAGLSPILDNFDLRNRALFVGASYLF